MKIERLSYHDNKNKWKLEPVDFLENLNLLVGVSGIGKTRTLKAIQRLKAIANGESLNGVSWDVCFVADNSLECSWRGEFETKERTPIDGGLDDLEGNEKVKIIYEELVCNDKIIVRRNQDEIIFNGTKTPKLSSLESIIELLKQEDIIVPVKKALDKIILADSGRVDVGWRTPISLIEKYEKSSLDSLRESELPVFIKLSILYRNFPEDFERIKETFISIFPRVSDVKVDTMESEDISIFLSKIIENITTVSIMEKGMKNWVKTISSGMLKTLMYISELFLSSDNCVVLIDEFENSLGVNCLDRVTDLILNNQKSQFFITSHHPYIINNISPRFWKILTRHQGIVTIKNASDLHISNSRQKAFIDLINILEEDEEGWDE